MSSTNIVTPQTHPDHEDVGRFFVGGVDGAAYYCDSYDPRISFWMTRLDCPDDHRDDQMGQFRRNVSERAIGRTFHRIYEEPDGLVHTALGGWTRREEFLALKEAFRP